MERAGRLVIAGGSGLIGRALTAAWTGAGGDVVVLSRREPGASGLPAGARAVRWESRTVGRWIAELEGCCAVINLAGENVGDGRWTAARKRRLRSSRLEPSRTLVEAIGRLAVRPQLFVQASAIGYYAPSPDGRPLDESSPSGSGFLPELSREWEAASADVEALGVRRVVMRTGVVLARDRGALAKMLPAFRLGVGGRLGDGRQHFAWIHLDDAVAALRFLVERPDLAGAFNLTAPVPVTNRELTAALGRVLHRPALLPVPAVALRLLFGEMAGIILGGDAVLPRRLLDAGFEFRFQRLEPALADLLGTAA
jgi:uncharacterized protein